MSTICHCGHPLRDHLVSWMADERYCQAMQEDQSCPCRRYVWDQDAYHPLADDEAIMHACATIFEAYVAIGDDEFLHHGDPEGFSANDFAQWLLLICRLVREIRPVVCTGNQDLMEALCLLIAREPDEDRWFDLFEDILDGEHERTDADDEDGV